MRMFDMLTFDLYELNFLTIIFRMGLAIIVGGFIGLERDIKQRAAGIRTHMLVCLGAAIVMMTNQYIFMSFPDAQIDITRMGAQVVSGIGFIGAGTILVTSEYRIKGLTTAAGLWAAAAIGLAIGIGFYEIALVGGLAILVIMILLRPFKHYILDHINPSDISLIVHTKDGLNSFIKLVSQYDVKIFDLKVEKELMINDDEKDLIFFVSLELGDQVDEEDLLEKLRMLPHIEDVVEVDY